VELVESKEPYVARTSQALLLGLAEEGKPRKTDEWKTWWDDGGKALFQAAARVAPELPAAAGASGEKALRSRTRDMTQYFSKLRKRGLDLLLLIDVTVSMTEELERMRAQVTEITSFLELLLDGRARMGFVTYGDAVVKRVPLTKRLDAFAREVEQKVKIFDDKSDRTVPEGVSKALEDALAGDNRIGWRRNAFRTILLLGDAPPLDKDAARRLAALAKKKGYTINTLIAPPPAYAAGYPPKPIFEEIAKLGGGLSAELNTPEELITRILVFAFGSNQEQDLRRFVHAYREVTGKANAGEE
jgi:hypothetical protein